MDGPKKDKESRERGNLIGNFAQDSNDFTTELYDLIQETFNPI